MRAQITGSTETNRLRFHAADTVLEGDRTWRALTIKDFSVAKRQREDVPSEKTLSHHLPQLWSEGLEA